MKKLKFRPDAYFRRIAAVLVAVLLIGWYARYWTGREVCNINRDLKQTTVSAKGHNIVAEVAEAEQDKTMGLSGRKCLGDGKGMLFVYPTTGDYKFWMKDMGFPIDMIWLDDDKNIVTVRSRVEPDTYPRTFGADKPAQYILEVKAGVAASADWTVGTKLDFNL